MIKSYFFDAVQSGGVYDRVYSSGDFSDYLDLLVGNGVFANPASNLQVSASSGMDVVVRAGSGWIDGRKIKNTADYTLTVDSSDVLLNRIDRVIFYVDYDAREMGIELLKGVSAVNAVAPSLTRTEQRYEMCLAEITINKQVTAISASMIRDTRADSSLCGYVAGLIDQIDATGLFDQFQAAFDEWFSDVQNSYQSRLLQKLVHRRVTTAESESTFNVVNYISSYAPSTDILEVYIEGLHLSPADYTLSSSGVVTLAVPITHTGTSITFVVLKNAIS